MIRFSLSKEADISYTSIIILFEFFMLSRMRVYVRIRTGYVTPVKYKVSLVIHPNILFLTPHSTSKQCFINPILQLMVAFNYR